MNFEAYFVGWYRLPALGASCELPHKHMWGHTVWSLSVWVGPITVRVGRW